MSTFFAADNLTQLGIDTSKGFAAFAQIAIFDLVTPNLLILPVSDPKTFAKTFGLKRTLLDGMMVCASKRFLCKMLRDRVFCALTVNSLKKAFSRTKQSNNPQVANVYDSIVQQLPPESRGEYEIIIGISGVEIFDALLNETSSMFISLRGERGAIMANAFLFGTPLLETGRARPFANLAPQSPLFVYAASYDPRQFSEMLVLDEFVRERHFVKHVGADLHDVFDGTFQAVSKPNSTVISADIGVTAQEQLRPYLSNICDFLANQDSTRQTTRTHNSEGTCSVRIQEKLHLDGDHAGYLTVMNEIAADVPESITGRQAQISLVQRAQIDVVS